MTVCCGFRERGSEGGRAREGGKEREQRKRQGRGGWQVKEVDINFGKMRMVVGGCERASTVAESR